MGAGHGDTVRGLDPPRAPGWGLQDVLLTHAGSSCSAGLQLVLIPGEDVEQGGNLTLGFTRIIFSIKLTLHPIRKQHISYIVLYWSNTLAGTPTRTCCSLKTLTGSEERTEVRDVVRSRIHFDITMSCHENVFNEMSSRKDRRPLEGGSNTGYQFYFWHV